MQQVETHKPTGKHTILDGKGVDFATLNNKQLLARVCRQAAKAAGATVLSTHSQQFEPQGVSVFCMLAESHISIHTYPEWGMFMADIFTCGDQCDPNIAAKHIVEALGCTDSAIKMWIRGLH